MARRTKAGSSDAAKADGRVDTSPERRSLSPAGDIEGTSRASALIVEVAKGPSGLGTQKQDVSCTDGNCPIHGALRLHGRHFAGVIKSARMRRTANIVIEKTRFIRKYERYERRLSSIKVHNPECISAKEGDKVEVFECRPLSKTKHFVITKKL